MCPFPSLVTHLHLQATTQPDIDVMCIWFLREMWDLSWALPEYSRQKLPTYLSVDSWSTDGILPGENDQIGHGALPLTMGPYAREFGGGETPNQGERVQRGGGQKSRNAQAE